MAIRNRVLKGLKWTTLSTIVVAIANVLKISVLARFLDKSDFGLMAILTLILGIMTLFSDLGISTAILHKTGTTKKVYSSLFWLNLGFCVLLYGILLSTSKLIAIFYNDPRLDYLTALLALNIVFSGFGTQFKTIEMKNLRFKSVAIIESFSAVISMVFAVLLALKGYGVLALVYSALLQFGLSNACLFLYGLNKYGLSLHFKFNETIPYLKIGVYQVGGQLINFFNKDLDILLIGKLLNPEILGGYSLAKQLVFRPLQIINPILIRVATPTLAKFQDQKEKLKEHYLTLVNLISSINIPIYAIIIVFAPIIVKVFYGEGFENIVVLVRLLSVYCLIRAIGNPIGSLVTATGKTNLEFYWNLMNLFITPIFIFLGAQYGITFVATALVIYMLIMFYPSWRMLVFKMTEATFRDFVYAVVKINPKFILGLLKSR